MSDTPTRLLVLGIDAANPDLLRHWAADGTMPHLGALMARGLVGDNRSVEGFVVGSTWPSLYTGVTPARHGYHYTVQVKPGTYDYHYPRVAHEPFWTALSRAGQRVAIIDVPLTELDHDINGMHIVDWSGIEALAAFSTSPPGIREEVTAKWGAYPLKHSCDGLRLRSSDFRSFTDALIRGVAMRAELTTHFLAKNRWDLFMQVFTESHCAGHQVWHLHDADHPAHDARMAAELGDPLRRIYAAIDTSIGRILDAAGDPNVLLITAHGMSYWFGAQFVLPEILIRLGASAAAHATPTPRPREGPATAAARQLWHLVPQSMRETIRPPRARLEPRIQGLPPLPSVEVDPGRSKCFVVRNGHLTGGIRLNLAGREPQGILAPGAEAEAFCGALAADLLAIVDERTGRPVIRRVVRTADLYRGDHLADLPDLLVDWEDTVPTGNSHHGHGAAATVRVHSPKIGRVEGTNQFTRTGDHRIGGMFVAAGKGISPGIMKRTVSNLDFAPTIAALLGVRLEGLDGTVIREVLPQR
jgi:predicted AlkP superfamily phosphohydrolase/phosphomutase